MKLTTLLPGIAGLATGLMLAWAVNATTLEQYSLADLVQQSDVGVIGEVTATESVYTEGRFYTIVTVQVDEVLFGQGDAFVQIRYPGGSAEINGVRVGENVAAATPRMEGMKAVYFLGGADSEGTRDIVGFTQGQLDIVARGDQLLISSPDQASLLSVNDFVARARALRDEQ
ncbi:MAG: hypothetical protein WD397_03415 [Wenzhouxiangellaceae bacterium]